MAHSYWILSFVFAGAFAGSLRAADNLPCRVAPEPIPATLPAWRTTKLSYSVLSNWRAKLPGHSIELRSEAGELKLSDNGEAVPIRRAGLAAYEATLPSSVSSATGPVRLRWPRAALFDPTSPASIEYSTDFWASATCPIEGKDVAVVIGLDWPAAGSPIGFDANGDRHIDPRLRSEFRRRSTSSPAFAVGDSIVQVESFDWATKRLRLATASIADQLPDFDFTDFSNKRGKLSDFKAGYLLLDLWAHWCAPCWAAFPELAAASKELRIPVLNLHADPDDVTAAKLLATRKPPGRFIRYTRLRGLHQGELQVDPLPALALVDGQRRFIGFVDTRNGIAAGIRQLLTSPAAVRN